MLSSKKLTCKGTLRQVFIRVYRLEIQSVMLVLFRSSFVNCCLPELLIGSIPPPHSLCVHVYNVYGVGGMGFWGLRQINTCRKVPLRVNFLDDDILHCLLWVLFFYGVPPRPPMHLWPEGVDCMAWIPGKKWPLLTSVGGKAIYGAKSCFVML